MFLTRIKIADPIAHPTKYTHYYTDYQTLKDVVAKGHQSCSALGVSVVTYTIGLVSGGTVGTTPVVGMMLVADLWSYVQFSKVVDKFNSMRSTEWLKTTYTHTWRNGGKNSGYVRSATAELNIVSKVGA